MSVFNCKLCRFLLGMATKAVAALSAAESSGILIYSKGKFQTQNFPFQFFIHSRLILSNLNRDTSRSKRTSIPFSESSDSLCGALMLWLYHYLALQVCRNNCSGHGYCDRSTKMCVCESFWMQDFFKVHFGTRESNCGRWLVALLFFCLFVCFFLFKNPASNTTSPFT